MTPKLPTTPSELQKLRDEMAHKSEALHVPYQSEIAPEYNAYRRGFDARHHLAEEEVFQAKLSVTKYHQTRIEMLEKSCELITKERDSAMDKVERLKAQLSQSTGMRELTATTLLRECRDALAMKCPTYVAHPQSVWYQEHQGKVLAKLDKHLGEVK